MRVLFVLISLLLVGCVEQKEPTYKQPTYLKCDPKRYGNNSFLWIVLDHENKLWTWASFNKKPTLKDRKLFDVQTYTLFSDEKFYWFNYEEGNGKNYYLDRASLIYDGYIPYQCEITEDLSYLRDEGIEKTRIKI